MSVAPIDLALQRNKTENKTELDKLQRNQPSANLPKTLTNKTRSGRAGLPFLTAVKARAEDGLQICATFDRAPGSESLRKLRVTLRRLRVLLGSGLFNNLWAQSLINDINVLAGHTSASRDLQTQVKLMKRLAGEIAGTKRSAKQFVLSKHDALFDQLSEKYRESDHAWVGEFERICRFVIEQADQNFSMWITKKQQRRIVRGLLKKSVEQIVTSASKIKRRKQHRRLHRTRIAVKRLRYQLAVAPGTRSSKIFTSLTGLQDILGELHDRQLLRIQLEALGTNISPDVQLALSRHLLTEEKRLFKSYKKKLRRLDLKARRKKLRRRFIAALEKPAKKRKIRLLAAIRQPAEADKISNS